MKLCHILLLTSILPVSESSGSNVPKGRRTHNPYSQVASPSSSNSSSGLASVITKEPTVTLEFTTPRSPNNSVSDKSDAIESQLTQNTSGTLEKAVEKVLEPKKNESSSEDQLSKAGSNSTTKNDEEKALKNNKPYQYTATAQEVSAFLAAHGLIKNKTVKTKHGYTFQVNNDPKNINFHGYTFQTDKNSKNITSKNNEKNEDRFQRVTEKWGNDLEEIRKNLLFYLNEKSSEMTDDQIEKYEEEIKKSAELAVKVMGLRIKKTWEKAPEIKLPHISTAQALIKYEKTPFHGELSKKFASHDKVTQQEVDDYAASLELPAAEALKDSKRADFLRKVFGKKETLLPDDVKKLSEHDQEFQKVLQQLPPIKHDRESICSGSAFFQSEETQEIIPLHESMEKTPENKRLELQTLAAIAKLADPKVFNIKEESITAIDKSLDTCKAQIDKLEQDINNKRKTLQDLVNNNSHLSSTKQEKLPLLRETSSISCPRTLTDVEKLHLQIKTLENEVSNLRRDYHTLYYSKEWATEARALQKALLLQLGSNVGMTLDQIPTITLAQRISLLGLNPLRLTLPVKTTETPLAVFLRIAGEQTTEKYSDASWRAKFAMYHRLTSKDQAIRWTEEQKQLENKKAALKELGNKTAVVDDKHTNNLASSSSVTGKNSQ